MNAREIPWRRWIPKIVVGILLLLGITLIVPAIERAKEAARRRQSKNNLKQLGLAFHTYHETLKCFPPGGTFSEDGSALHGWGPVMWPYIEAQFYSDMIDYDAPWDAPHNSHIFKFEYSIFRSPNIPMKSSAEGFIPGHYIANENLFHRNSSSSFKDMKGGLAHNWLLTDQLQDWWPWGSPYNWGPLEWPRPGADSENGWSGGGAHILMADGAVKYLESETDPKIIRAYREAPALPESDAIEKTPNPYRFESPPWKWKSLKLNDKTDDTYCRVLITPAGEFDTAYVQFDNGNYGVELVTDDVKYLLNEFPEITTMRLEMSLDDELLDVLLRNKKLANLTVGVIALSSEGIERLKEFPALKYLSGRMSDEIHEQIRASIPDLRLSN
ncbi:MAG TPA: DUF1559 domain-containing protein [Planctomycetaceae bacterium]|nr:DUF1559 domain-containing protein [Planctomycetaceae bacterium]